MSKSRCTNCTHLRRQLNEARATIAALQDEIAMLRPQAARWRREMADAQMRSDRVHSIVETNGGRS